MKQIKWPVKNERIIPAIDHPITPPISLGRLATREIVSAEPMIITTQTRIYPIAIPQIVPENIPATCSAVNFAISALAAIKDESSAFTDAIDIK